MLPYSLSKTVAAAFNGRVGAIRTVVGLPTLRGNGACALSIPSKN